MNEDEKMIVDAFLEAHREVYPNEEDLRQRLDPERLGEDAAALLKLGVEATAIISLVLRDMRKRPSMPNQIAPKTIRFCIRSVESAAKIHVVGKGTYSALGDWRARKQAARMALTPESFSYDDYRRVCGIGDPRPDGNRYAALSDGEKWRWHAYNRVWRVNRGLGGPPPFDVNGDWRDDEFDKWALDAWRAKNRNWRFHKTSWSGEAVA